tara:strand:- start:10634 stop:11290 length:657 start_codon:yes stop_codon:yes gene_type:complete
VKKKKKTCKVKGLTEEEVLDIIKKTVDYLAPSFRFGYYDIDDMRQEGTIFCLEALPSFNFDRSIQDNVGDALLTFLKTHVRWRFLNMRRKSLTRVEPPPCDCKLCKTDSANRLDCKKYSNWVKRNTAKRSLMEPFDVNDIYSADASFVPNIDESILSSDIMSILNEHVPSHMRSDYRKFVEGVTLPKTKKEKLVLKIKSILCEHYSNEAAEWSDDEDR